MVRSAGVTSLGFATPLILFVLALTAQDAALAENVWQRGEPSVEDVDNVEIRGTVDFDASHYTYHFPGGGPPSNDPPATNTARWTAPPAELRPGDRVQMDLTCTQERNAHISASCMTLSGFRFETPAFGADALERPQVTQVLVFEPGEGADKAFLELEAGLPSHRFVRVRWTYVRQEGRTPPTKHVGTTPPVTKGTAPSGLSASLDTGRLVASPGANSGTLNVTISGWRQNTADPVEIRFPQAGEDRGILVSGLVVFPGNTTFDPSNMAEQTHNRGFVFRAKESAPPGITAVCIVVRQRRESGPAEPVQFDEVRLVVHVVVPPADAHGGALSPPIGGGTGSEGTGGTSRPPVEGKTANERFEAGSEALHRGDRREALAELEECVRLEPKMSHAWEMIGLIHSAESRWPEAEAAYRKALGLNAIPDSQMGLAEALLRQGERDAAIEAAKVGLEWAQETGEDLSIYRSLLEDLGMGR